MLVMIIGAFGHLGENTPGGITSVKSQSEYYTDHVIRSDERQTYNVYSDCLG
jgi:hypothetical protein